MKNRFRTIPIGLILTAVLMLTAAFGLYSVTNSGSRHINDAERHEAAAFMPNTLPGYVKPTIYTFSEVENQVISGNTFVSTIPAPLQTYSAYKIMISNPTEFYRLSKRMDGRLDINGPNQTQPANISTPMRDFFRRANYILGDNINYSGMTEFVSFGTSQSPFEGMFDGQGFEITNLAHDYSAAYGTVSGIYTLFAYNSGIIKNVGIVYGANDISVNSSLSISGLVGYNEGTVERCYVEVKGTGFSGRDKVGGIAVSNGGIIRNCYFAGRLSSTAPSSADAFAVNYTGASGAESSHFINLFYDSTILTSTANSFGTGLSTADMQSNFSTSTYTDWYKPSEWGLANTYPKLCGAKLNSSSELEMSTPADIIYFPKMTARYSGYIFCITNCIDMIFTAPTAYVMSNTPFKSVLKSKANTSCTYNHPDTDNNHALLNFRIHTPMIDDANKILAMGLVRLSGTNQTGIGYSGNGVISNINFVGYEIIVPSLSYNQSCNLNYYIGIASAYCNENLYTYISGINASGTVKTDQEYYNEDTGKIEYSYMGASLYIGGLAGYFTGTLPTEITDCTFSGILDGGTHVNYANASGTAMFGAVGGIIGYCNRGNSTTRISKFTNLSTRGTFTATRAIRREHTLKTDAMNVSVGGIAGTITNFSEHNNCSSSAAIITGSAEAPGTKGANPNYFDIDYVANKIYNVSASTFHTVYAGGLVGYWNGSFYQGIDQNTMRYTGTITVNEDYGTVKVAGVNTEISRMFQIGGLIGGGNVFTSDLAGRNSWLINYTETADGTVFGRIVINNPTDKILNNGIAVAKMSGASGRFKNVNIKGTLIFNTYSMQRINVSGIALGGEFDGCVSEVDIQVNTGITKDVTAPAMMSNHHYVIAGFAGGDGGLYSTSSYMRFSNSISKAKLTFGSTTYNTNVGVSKYLIMVGFAYNLIYAYNCSNQYVDGNKSAITLNRYNVTSIYANVYISGLFASSVSTSTAEGCRNYAKISLDNSFIAGNIANPIYLTGLFFSVASIANCINYGELSILNETATASVNGNYEIGGICRQALAGGIIQNSFNFGEIKMTAQQSETTGTMIKIGGISVQSPALMMDCINNGKITFLSKRGKVDACANIGGLVGDNSGADISSIICDSINTGNIDIDGEARAGGIFGTTLSGGRSLMIQSCINYGTLTGKTQTNTAQKDLALGGIIGYANNANTIVNIYNCLVYGDVLGTARDSGYFSGVAGIVGLNNCTFYNVVVYGAVSGGTRAGIIAGSLMTSTTRLTVINFLQVFKAVPAGYSNVNAYVGHVYAAASAIVIDVATIGTTNTNATNASRIGNSGNASADGNHTIASLAGIDKTYTNNGPSNAKSIYNESFFLRKNSSLDSALSYTPYGKSDTYRSAANGFQSSGSHVLPGGTYSGMHLYSVSVSGSNGADYRKFGLHLADNFYDRLSSISTFLNTAERNQLSSLYLDCNQLIRLSSTSAKLECEITSIYFNLIKQGGATISSYLPANETTTKYNGDTFMTSAPSVAVFESVGKIKLLINVDTIKALANPAGDYYFTFISSISNGATIVPTTAALVRVYNPTTGQYVMEDHSVNFDSNKLFNITGVSVQVSKSMGYIRVQQASGIFKDWEVIVQYLPEEIALDIDTIYHDSYDNQTANYTITEGSFTGGTYKPSVPSLTATPITSSLYDTGYSVEWNNGVLQVNFITSGYAENYDFKPYVKVYNSNASFAMGTQVPFGNRSYVLQNTVFLSNYYNNGVVTNTTSIEEIIDGSSVYKVVGRMFLAVDFGYRLPAGYYIVEINSPDFYVKIGVSKIYSDEAQFVYVNSGESGSSYSSYAYIDVKASVAGSVASPYLISTSYSKSSRIGTMSLSIEYGKYPILDTLKNAGTTGNFIDMLRFPNYITTDATAGKVTSVEIRQNPTSVVYYSGVAYDSENPYKAYQTTQVTYQKQYIIRFTTTAGRNNPALSDYVYNWTFTITESVPRTDLRNLYQNGAATAGTDIVKTSNINVVRNATNGDLRFDYGYSTSLFIDGYYTIKMYKDGDIASGNIPVQTHTFTTGGGVSGGFQLYELFSANTTGGQYKFVVDVALPTVTAGPISDYPGIAFTRFGTAIPAGGTFDYEWEPFYLQPMYVEKTADTNSYFINMSFGGNPPYKQIFGYRADNNKEFTVAVIRENSTVVEYREEQFNADNTRKYEGIIRNVKRSDRDKDLKVVARYSNDEGSLSNFVDFVIPKFSKLYKYMGDLNDNGIKDAEEYLLVVESIADENGDEQIIYYDRLTNLYIYENTPTIFRLIAENTNYYTDYEINLTDADPVQYVDLLITVPSDFNERVVVSLFSVVLVELYDGGGVKIGEEYRLTRTTTAMFGTNSEDNGDGTKTVTYHFAKQILTYFSVDVMLPYGYKAGLSTPTLILPQNLPTGFPQIAGRQVIYLSSYKADAEVIEVIVIADDAVMPWGYYYMDRKPS